MENRKVAFSGVFWKFGERFAAQGVSIVVSIVLARLLSPEEYGIIPLTTIFISLCNAFVTSGFGSALIQKKDADDLDYSSCFYTSLGVSILLYGVMFFAAPYIAAFYEVPVLTAVVRVLSLRLPLSAISTVQHAYVSKHYLFKKFFLSTLLGTVVSGVVGIYMAYHGFGVWALVAQELIINVMDKIVLFITVKWRPKLCYSWEREKKLLSYGWKLLASALLNTGYNELRGLIIGKKYTTADLAFYNKGKSFPEMIGVNVEGPINAVLFPLMSNAQNNVSVVKEMTRKSIRIGSYAMAPLLFGLAAVAPTLVPVLFTEKWNPCVVYMQILCFVNLFYPIHTANLQAIKALGRSDLFLKLEITKKVVGLVVLLASIPFGVFWMVASMIVTTIAACFINAYPNRKLLGYSYTEQFKDLFPGFAMAFVMGSLVYPLQYLPIHGIAILAMQVVLGTIIYLIFSLVFKIDSFFYLWDILKGFLPKKK
ncbi:MAG: lipopolysaccharide biosynthesis protein [Oscillospiraceae bacterium]|nr:lipopolysaccharide biosynthesis protein [Oscillospiraceae bacterium]